MYKLLWLALQHKRGTKGSAYLLLPAYHYLQALNRGYQGHMGRRKYYEEESNKQDMRFSLSLILLHR